MSKSSARRSRARRRLVLLTVVAAAVAAVTAYRDRELRRHADAFLERYGT